MLQIIVRSKRDADAIRAVITRFYPEWDIVVRTLRGFRSPPDVETLIDEYLTRERYRYTIVMLGKEDEELSKHLEHRLPPNALVHVVSRAKIRNATLEQLHYEIEVARSKFRLITRWISEYQAYVFRPSGYGEILRGLDINPAYDVFIGIGEYFRDHVRRVTGRDVGLNPLIVRKFGGEHYIYSGPKPVLKLKITDLGLTMMYESLSNECVDVDLDAVGKLNEDVLKIHEEIALSQLKAYNGWADVVLVPWSGGKDSTTVLLMASKVFGKRKVRAIFADTGLEFPATEEYISELSKVLGIECVRVKAYIDQGLLRENLPLPTHDNRWCTARKIAAIESYINELKGVNKLIVIGDRDAESEARARRAPVRHEAEDRIVITPIKMWSTAHVQLYLHMNKIPLNKLYEYGFYRIGCYICPSLRSWELSIVLHKREIIRGIRYPELFRKFLEQIKGIRVSELL